MNNQLYSMRVRHRLSQSELARRAGISRTTVCLLERRGGYPSFRVAAAICRVLDCDYGEVFPIGLSMR